MSNPFIRTYTGKAFYPFNPVIEDIDILDIGHSLSLICRFNGHVKGKSYSVAQHCCHVCDLASENNKLAALMHDSQEVFCGDLVSPIKRQLSNYIELESKLEIIISKKFGYQFPYDEEVKEIDFRILNSELRDLMNNADYDVNLAYSFIIKPWTSKKAEREFLKRFEKYKNI